MKALRKNPFAQKIIGGVAAFYMWLVYKTSRWELRGFHIPESYLRQQKGFLTCFWHERLFMVVFGWKRSFVPFHMLISAHADGQLIANAVGHFDIHWLSGSSSQGGRKALKEGIRLLKKGEVVGITPDGPRGPRRRVSSGTLTMARLAGVDLLPISYSFSRYIQLKSWDRFLLPLPFGRGIIEWGAPLKISTIKKSVNPAEKTQEELQEALREKLSTLTNNLDLEVMGQTLDIILEASHEEGATARGSNIHKSNHSKEGNR